jgi:hypothetical protein
MHIGCSHAGIGLQQSCCYRHTVVDYRQHDGSAAVFVHGINVSTMMYQQLRQQGRQEE